MHELTGLDEGRAECYDLASMIECYVSDGVRYGDPILISYQYPSIAIYKFMMHTYDLLTNIRVRCRFSREA